MSRICREIVLFCAPKRERATDSKPITTFHKFARFGRNLTAISALMVLGENRHLAQFAQITQFECLRFCPNKRGPPTYRVFPVIVKSTGMLALETVLGLNFHVRTVLRTDLSSSGLPVLCAIETLVTLPLVGSTETTQTPLPATRCERASCGYSGRGA